MSDLPTATDRIEIIRQLQNDYTRSSFVETGSATGDTPAALEDYFGALYTVEADKERYWRVARRFAGSDRIHPIFGPSNYVLPWLVEELDALVGADGVLYWLDAHLARSTPVLDEVAAIRGWPEGAVVLVDDVRLFGSNGWPTIETVVDCLGPDFACYVELDVLRAVHRSLLT